MQMNSNIQFGHIFIYKNVNSQLSSIKLTRFLGQLVELIFTILSNFSFFTHFCFKSKVSLVVSDVEIMFSIVNYAQQKCVQDPRVYALISWDLQNDILTFSCHLCTWCCQRRNKLHLLNIVVRLLFHYVELLLTNTYHPSPSIYLF